MERFELEVWPDRTPGEYIGFELVVVYSYDKDSALATARARYPDANTICLFDKEFYNARY